MGAGAKPLAPGGKTIVCSICKFFTYTRFCATHLEHLLLLLLLHSKLPSLENKKASEDPQHLYIMYIYTPY